MPEGGSFIVVVVGFFVTVDLGLLGTSRICEVNGSTENLRSYPSIDLHPSHLKYYLNSFPKIADQCRNDTACPYKVS